MSRSWAELGWLVKVPRETLQTLSGSRVLSRACLWSPPPHQLMNYVIVSVPQETSLFLVCVEAKELGLRDGSCLQSPQALLLST